MTRYNAKVSFSIKLAAVQAVGWAETFYPVTVFIICPLSSACRAIA
jgi:hypothetical protein